MEARRVVARARRLGSFAGGAQRSMKARPAYEIGFAWLDTSPRTPRAAHPAQQSAARTPPRRSTPQTRAPRTTATRAATTRAAPDTAPVHGSAQTARRSAWSEAVALHPTCADEHDAARPRSTARAAAPDIESELNNSTAPPPQHGRGVSSSARCASAAKASRCAGCQVCCSVPSLDSSTAPSSPLSSPAARPSPLRSALSSPRPSTASPRHTDPYRWGGAPLPRSQQVAVRSPHHNP